MTRYICDRCEKTVHSLKLIYSDQYGSRIAELCSDCVAEFSKWLKEKK